MSQDCCQPKVTTMILACSGDKNKDMNLKRQEIDLVKQAVRDLPGHSDAASSGVGSGPAGAFCPWPPPISPLGTGACSPGCLLLV